MGLYKTDSAYRNIIRVLDINVVSALFHLGVANELFPALRGILLHRLGEYNRSVGPENAVAISEEWAPVRDDLDEEPEDAPEEYDDVPDLI